MAQNNHWVMDYETMINCFCAVFIHHKTDEKKVFVVHDLRNNFTEFLKFLRQNIQNDERHISFNGLGFDSQITQYIIKNAGQLSKFTDPNDIVSFIYEKAQHTINNKEQPVFPEWKLSIKQIDVFKINHWDNANKRTSLKWAEYAMDWHNILDMPLPHNVPIHTQQELDMIIDYCTNDVLATKKILYLSKPLLDVRTKINQSYGLNCYNYSNTKLGSELLLKLYCEKTNKHIPEVKGNRTRRDIIHVKDIIFPYIEFKSPELQGFHQMIKEMKIINTRKDFKYQLSWNGYQFDYGTGGIHQCIETGIYKADDRFIIKDLDVASLYPSIACNNQMYPAHLGREFFEVYKNDIVDVRLNEKAKPSDQRNMAIIEGFKEAANATYGNSNSEFSWLYDPQYTMQTTINGQLLLTMLVEELILSIPEIQLLQTNTDGATFKFPKESLPVYEKICKNWEKITKLTLEFADYSAMYIWDVNNYFAIYTNGKAKCKGRFEWEDLEKHKYTHLHKNKSYLIVAKAIFNYFVNNIPPEVYLASNRNIMDYCAGAKANTGWIFNQICTLNGEVTKTNLQKTIRYYITNRGCKIIKFNKSDKREIQIEAGKWMQQDFSKYIDLPWEEYDVNESYYLDQIYKEIHNILPAKINQLKLF